MSSNFSVVQCVAKRTRQLERLLYMLESTAAKFQNTKFPLTTTDCVLLSSTVGSQVQRRYGKLLLEFLEKERGLRILAQFADSTHLESYDEELQQLFVLVEDEELLRQRVGRTFDFLAGISIDQDIVALVRKSERVWDDLLPRTSSAVALIRSIRGDSDPLNNEVECSAVHPWPSTVRAIPSN